MLFVATCVDKPHSADKRKENRPAHVSCLNGLGARLKIGGALPAAAHRTPIGSMITFEGESEDEISSPFSPGIRTCWRACSKASA